MRHVEVRPMIWADLPLLVGWLNEPHVRRWWRNEPRDLASVEAEYGACITGGDPTELFVIDAGDRAIGMIQRYRFTDEPAWTRAFEAVVDVTDAAGIDYLIGDPERIGQGLGTAAITVFSRLTFASWPVVAIVTNVDETNVGSWRALERSGYTRIWAGRLASPDPSDAGPQVVYRLERSGQPLAPR